jgi:hypothetical protein
MSVTPEVVDGYFEQYGWSYTRDEGSSDWTTGFRGDVANFRIFVKLTENWVYFTIIPFVIGPQDSERRARLHWHLLRLNRDINMAKFALDEDDDVVLTVELPSENLDYSEFSDAINALCYYADDTYLEMLNLAQTSDASSRYDPKDESVEDDLDWGE